MPFGMGPAGWAYALTRRYPYTGISYPAWPWYAGSRGNRGLGRGRGRGLRQGWVAPYWHGRYRWL